MNNSNTSSPPIEPPTPPLSGTVATSVTQSAPPSSVFATTTPSTSSIVSPIPNPNLLPPSTGVATTHPFYFSNLPPLYNSHTSLPLYDPLAVRISSPLNVSSPLGYSQFEVGESSTSSHLSASSVPVSGFGCLGSSGLLGSGGLLSSGGSLPPGVALVAPNITNLVTVRLSTPEDYLTWHTQFTAVLVSHGLLGLVDGSHPPPSSTVLSSTGELTSSPQFHDWLRLDQSVRSWIFATLSPEVLIDIRDCPTSYHVWKRLSVRFMHSSMARAIELKRMLTNIKKSESQSMDAYLREIKTIADNLASVNSTVPQSDLVHYTLLGLGRDYETLVTTLTHLPLNLTFDDLRPRLLLHEQRIRQLRELDDPISHPALATTHTPNSNNNSSQSNRQNNSNSHSRGRGGGRYNNYRGRNNNRGGGTGGRGRGYNQFHSNQASASQYRGVPAGNSSQSGILGSNPPNLVCQICFNPGHSALQCPRFPSSAGHTPASLASSFTAMSLGDGQESTWFPDTGASAHMTPFDGQGNGDCSTSGCK